MSTPAVPIVFADEGEEITATAVQLVEVVVPCDMQAGTYERLNSAIVIVLQSML